MIGRLPKVVLRFARTDRGTYIAVTGKAPRRVSRRLIADPCRLSPGAAG